MNAILTLHLRRFDRISRGKVSVKTLIGRFHPVRRMWEHTS
ncbi:RDD domain-containing protein [Roseibium sp. TrichSKD4]|nr:RDD domain-containing protein [Roseibium sp. TrichSKD4]